VDEAGQNSSTSFRKMQPDGTVTNSFFTDYGHEETQLSSDGQKLTAKDPDSGREFQLDGHNFSSTGQNR